jgi:hypothetical protein
LYAVGAAGLALLLASSGATAEGCKTMTGKMTLTAVSGPTCLSPVGICATGELSGGLKATLSFTGTTVVPTVDTPSTSAIVVTGDSTFTTRVGDLLTKDAIVLRTAGAGEFAEVDTIVGATGELAGSTGTLQATGAFTGAGGSGTYTATVCTP